MASKILLLVAIAASSGVAAAQGDVTTFRIGYDGSNPNDFKYYGQSSGIAAYSFATQSCNIGNQNIPWTSGSGTQHPVMSQNMFRLEGRRFEQLGQSWLKHGFCALCEGGCGNGSGSGCASVLYPGCADTYWDTLNDGQGGGPKYRIDPASGNHQHSAPSPSGPAAIRGRLQVAVSDVTPASNPGADYWIEGAYISYYDHQNGNAHNNVTWRKVTVNSNLTLTGAGSSNVGESCVYGWKEVDPAVVIEEVTNSDEAGAGIHGYYQVASRVWDNGDGTWDYVYVVNNQNSTQGAGSFSVPFGGASISGEWFNDVDYHSGELQDGTDWSMALGADRITWTCPQTYAQNANANAINWCTAYSFGFTADAGPVSDVGELTMFEPGVGDVLVFPLDGPGGGLPAVGSSFCAGDGSATACPCSNPGSAGQGCRNSSGAGATLSGVGTASVTGDTVVLSTVGAPAGVSALFFSGTNQLNGGQGFVFGDGLMCAAGQIVRLEVAPTDGGGGNQTTIGIAATEGAVAGETRYYQTWFRDPSGVCGNGHGTSNALAVSWVP